MPKQYRVAIIGRTGHGDYGHGLDTAWSEFPNISVAAVADDDKVGLAKVAKKLKVEQAFSDYRKMLDEVKPDLVSISQRWIDQHREMAIAAAERGIHIFMEKPYCRSLEEADQIMDACQRTHVKLALATPTTYSPKLQTIRNIIASGELGTVLEYRARGKEDHRGGGEDLWVLGTHVLDMIRAIGGTPKSCFAIVTENGKPITKADVKEGREGIGPLAGDSIQAMYQMPNGSTAYFASTRKAAGKPSRYGLQIFGSKGVLELLEGPLPSVKFLPDPSWSPGRSSAKWLNVSSAGIDKPEPLTDAKYQSRHYLAISDLLKAIENNQEPACGINEARTIVEMIAAVFESQRVGTPVTLPLETRKNPLTLL